MLGIIVSRLRPPWLETMMPSTPACSANFASSGCSTPLSKSLVFTTERNQSTSCQVNALCRPGSDASRRRTACGSFTPAGHREARPQLPRSQPQHGRVDCYANGFAASRLDSRDRFACETAVALHIKLKPASGAWDCRDLFHRHRPVGAQDKRYAAAGC